MVAREESNGVLFKTLVFLKCVCVCERLGKGQKLSVEQKA